MYMCALVCAHATYHKCGGQKFILSFHYVGSRDQTQIISLATSIKTHWSISLTPLSFFFPPSLPLSLPPSPLPFPHGAGDKTFAFFRGRMGMKISTSAFKLKRSSCPPVPWSTRLTFGIPAVIIANPFAVITFFLSLAWKVIRRCYYCMCSESILL